MITQTNGHTDLTLDKELRINGLFKKNFLKLLVNFIYHISLQ